MTRIVIKKIIWDDWNQAHISKHGVSRSDVETAGENLVWHKRAGNSRYLGVGRVGTRIISLIVSRTKKTTYYLVTARDASKKERKKLHGKKS